jgi:hypothetical protein
MYHQRMEFTFHNSNIILDRVLSIVIFLRESSLQIFYGRHSNQVNRYEISISEISNDNGSFTFYVDGFFPTLLPRLLPDLSLNMSNTASVL